MASPGLQLRTTTRLETGLRVDPRVILSAKLLELSHNELEGRIEAELSENPALVREHQYEETITDAQILRRLSAHELKPRGDDREQWRSLAPDDVTPDWIDLAASHTSLDEHLRAQLATILPRSLGGLAEYVVGSLDPNGYLPESVEEIALGAGVSVESAARVIAALKTCDPLGVGASGVQEGLLLQLGNDESVEGRLARRIVREHLEEMTARGAVRLARKYGVMPAVVEEAFARVLACAPFPADGFTRAHSLVQNVAAQADLILRQGEYGWEIVPMGADPAGFSVEDAYKTRLAARGVEPGERRHLAHYIGRAGDFISSLEQRRLTLLKIGAYLIERQMDFIVTGDYEYLAPLTRSEAARELGLHESTVSRATADKFVQIDSGEIVAFEVFFKPALRVRKMIEGILATEDPADPLSDDRIAEILATKGVVVARRTVNKYRDGNRQLSSRRRRVA